MGGVSMNDWAGFRVVVAVTALAAVLSAPPAPAAGATAAASSTVALDESRNRVWCVNPDNDSVSALNSQGGRLVKVFERTVGDDPRTLAVAPDGSVWVAVPGEGVVRVLEPEKGEVVATVSFLRGSRPFGVAFSPDGSAAFVTLEASGEVVKVGSETRTVVATAPVCPTPRNIVVTADSKRVLVGRFISPQERGEIVEVSPDDLRVVGTIPLAVDPGPDTPLTGRGVPNYLGAMAVSPDGARLWVPSKKDNTARGLARDGQPLTFENTVRTISSQIDLARSAEVLAARIDHNNADLAAAACYSPAGDRVFVAFQGSNRVDVLDAGTGRVVATIPNTGLAPQGLALSADGRRLYVHGFLSRSVLVYDVGGLSGRGREEGAGAELLAECRTIDQEQLAADVLRGKRIFFNAADPRMCRDGYISCASCHADGGHDGRVWDFTDRGEGLRNTLTLLGRKGVGHGGLHWSANFDEVQDFEHDIRGAFGGRGFLHDEKGNDLLAGGSRDNPLGGRKAGLSKDLDALAAFVSSLDSVGVSPHRNPDGSLTADAEAGKAVFFNNDFKCMWCHTGRQFTDSSVGGRLHEVGTIRPTSGKRIGSTLYGMDTPSLKGLWATAPYFHDGSAATLMDVINASGDAHGGIATLPEEQKRQLVAYLLQIDDLEKGAIGYGAGYYRKPAAGKSAKTGQQPTSRK